MQRWTIIVTAAVVGLWLVVQSVRDFVANDPIGYFAAKPGRLLPVAVIALGGGALAYFYTRRAPRVQREICLWSWGVAASSVSAFDVFFVPGIIRMVWSNGLIEIGLHAATSLALVLILFMGIAAYCWWEFSRTWRDKIL